MGKRKLDPAALTSTLEARMARKPVSLKKTDTDGDVIKLARQLDVIMHKQHDVLNKLRESNHPKIDEIVGALEEQCETLAWPTHVVQDHLEHPERYETGWFGIRRKGTGT